VIVVHHLEKSRSHRIVWLLEELGAKYSLQHYRRDPVTISAPESLRDIHPLGKSPVITDGEVTLAESGAIIDYLVDKFGPADLAPLRGTAEWRRYNYWLHYAEGSAMPPLLMKLVFDRMEDAPASLFLRPFVQSIARRVKKDVINPRLNQHLDYMEAELGKSAWFAGDKFSAADIQMSYPIEASVGRAGLNESRPHLMRFLDRIHQRPAYMRAKETG
jgi:glutathione S-transferase